MHQQIERTRAVSGKTKKINKMKKFKIIGKTNSYIANRDARFNGKTEVVIESDLTLKEAQTILLEMFNEMYQEERGYCKNWGIAVIRSKKHSFGATATFKDGTRSFDYDSRLYSIEEI